MKASGHYKLWNNSVTYHDVYLLPNATRLFGFGSDAGLDLQYVSEVLFGEALGDGQDHFIDVISALTPEALQNPVIPVGSVGALDFSRGTLQLPERADFVLYLDEVSGKWLADSFGNGYIRAMLGDAAAINAYLLEDGALPQGEIADTVAQDGAADEWLRYWIGYTPETAPGPDVPLICLLVNPTTDEALAWRTSVDRMARGEAPIPLSLFLYRDGRNDRQGIEQYNVMFFDTPEGQQNIVNVYTDVLDDGVLQMPGNIEIVLRAFPVEGVDLPVYAIGEHLYAMNDATDGIVRLYNDLYRASFDGDVFDSPYIRIEGIAGDAPEVTLRQDQYVWPEYTGENTAESVSGYRYERVDGMWTLVNETLPAA